MGRLVKTSPGESRREEGRENDDEFTKERMKEEKGKAGESREREKNIIPSSSDRIT